MSTQTRAWRALATTVAASLLLAACGNSSDESDAGGNFTGDITVSAQPTTSTGPLTGTDTGLANDGGTLTAEPRFFNDTSPWNTRVDSAAVDRNSDKLIRLASERLGVVENVAGGAPRVQQRIVDDPVYINTESWTVPVVVGGTPTSLVCRQIVCSDDATNDDIVLDVPQDIDPDPRYDGWFTIFDTSRNIAYDLWRARREDDGSISYQYMKVWDLGGPGFQSPGQVSARGSGLPLFAGLIRPGELQSGLIDHALAISVPGPSQGNYVQPASATDGIGRVGSLPEGARIRLKADAVIERPRDPKTGKLVKLTKQQRRMADAIIAALRTYGAIVVDRAAVPTLYAQRDVTRDMIRGNELQGMHLEDFEVVQLGERFPYPPDDEGNGTGVPIAPSTPTASPTGTISTPSATPTSGATP